MHCAELLLIEPGRSFRFGCQYCTKDGVKIVNRNKPPLQFIIKIGGVYDRSSGRIGQSIFTFARGGRRYAGIRKAFLSVERMAHGAG